MIKKVIIVPLFIAGALVIGWLLLREPVNTPTPAPVATKIPQVADFTASFEIYTNGTRRIFTSSMYHHQSADVFIQNPDPSVIHVAKAGITWADFFETLPFTLTKECLVTGTKQTFCNNETQKLRFFLNDSELPNALDLTIKPEDHLRILYE